MVLRTTEKTPAMNAKEQEEMSKTLQKDNKSRLYIMCCIVIALVSISIPYLKFFFFIPLNYYIQSSYIPKHVLNHYIEYPLSDVKFEVPVYFDSFFSFPDLPETIRIQVDSRMNHEFYSMLDYSINLIPGNNEDYVNGKYPETDMFINCILNDGNAIKVDGDKNHADLFFNLQSVDSNDFPFFMTQLLVDHCFKDEIIRYAPDSFYKNFEKKQPLSDVKERKGENDETFPEEDSRLFYLTHFDFVHKKIIEKLLRNDTIMINIEVFVVGGVPYNIEMKQALEKQLNPMFALLSDFFTFNIDIHDLDFKESQLAENVKETDGIFPVEFTNLPLLWDLYQDQQEKANIFDKITMNMVFYPYSQGGDIIKGIVVDSEHIYSDIENKYFNIQDWGMIYFSHLRFDESSKVENLISEGHLQDCVWAFSEGLLNFIGVPDENMYPSVRTKIFKRYMIMQYFVYYSNLLNELRRLLAWNDLQSLAKTDPKKSKLLAEVFIQSIEIRKEAVDLAKKQDLNGSLSLCREMVNLVYQGISSV